MNFDLGFSLDTSDEDNANVVLLAEQPPGTVQPKDPAVAVKSVQPVQPEKLNKKQCTFHPPMDAELAKSMQFKMFAPETKKKINWAMTMYSQWCAI